RLELRGALAHALLQRDVELANLFLGALALGDVEIHADHAAHAPALVADGRRLALDDAHGAIAGALDDEFAGELALAAERRLHVLVGLAEHRRLERAAPGLVGAAEVF